MPGGSRLEHNRPRKKRPERGRRGESSSLTIRTLTASIVSRKAPHGDFHASFVITLPPSISRPCAGIRFPLSRSNRSGPVFCVGVWVGSARVSLTARLGGHQEGRRGPRGRQWRPSRHRQLGLARVGSRAKPSVAPGHCSITECGQLALGACP